jgi:hypothetical protein
LELIVEIYLPDNSFKMVDLNISARCCQSITKCYMRGPTPTHRLLATSPAIDKGNSFGLALDQRGFARIFNFPGIPDAIDGTDIGAFEHLGPTAAAVIVSGSVRTAKGLPIRNASVTIFGGDLVQPASVSTGSFGSYSFKGLRAGQTYFIMVSTGRYAFQEPVRTVVPVDNVDDLDFTAN